MQTTGQVECKWVVKSMQLRITSKTKEIEQAIKRMTPYFDEYGAAALAHTEEVRVYVDKIMAGIKSLDLYIGKDVDVTALRKGTSACSSIPLTIMQRKLIMVEEIAVFTHVDESSDHRNFKGLSQLLASNDEFVAQIFPTERCIVCMCSTRRDVYYKTPTKGCSAIEPTTKFSFWSGMAKIFIAWIPQ